MSQNQMLPKKLAWSEDKQPNEYCPYNHAVAQTPFGRILITWKGWKEDVGAYVEEFPGGYQGPYAPDVAQTKVEVEREWERLLRLCYNHETEGVVL